MERKTRFRHHVPPSVAAPTALPASEVAIAAGSTTPGWLLPLGFGVAALALGTVAFLHFRRKQSSSSQQTESNGDAIANPGESTEVLSKQLVEAIYEQDVGRIRGLFYKGALDIMKPVYLDGVTHHPLMSAINSGARVELVKLLLGAAGDINMCTDGATPLTACASLGRADIAATLLKRGADALAADDAGLTAAHVAARHGRLAILQVLFLHAPQSIDYPRESDGATPLMLAVAENEAAVVDFLLSKAEVQPGRAMKTTGVTALMIAAAKGDSHVGVLERLLAAPGSRAFLDAVAHDGRTALGAAAAKSNALDCVDKLLTAGANPNGALALAASLGASLSPSQRAQFVDAQPIVLAAHGKANLNTLRRLADAGADINAVLSDGRPLLLSLVDGTGPSSGASVPGSMAGDGGGGTGGAERRKVRYPVIEFLLDLEADPHQPSEEVVTTSAGGAESESKLVSRTAAEAAAASGDDRLKAIFAGRLKV